MEPFNINALQHQNLITASGEPLSKSLVLSSYLNLKDLFVHHEILPPGLRASRPHSHTLREEMVLILTGFPTAHIGDQTIPLKPGDFISFPLSASHYIQNPSSEEARFLVICSNPPDDQTVFCEAPE